MADITMPQLGETVTEGTITKWFKKVGEQIAVDEPLFEVSTDKVDSEVPSSAAGYVTEILVNEGQTVDVGTKIAIVSADQPSEGEPSGTPPEPAAEAEAAPEPEPEPEAAKAEAPAPPPETPAAPSVEPDGDGGASKLLSPVVRRLINEHGLDPGRIPGTGQDGRITRTDVLAFIDQNGGRTTPAPAPAPAAQVATSRPPTTAPAPAPKRGADDSVISFSNIRRRTAEHMIRSQATSAHVLVATEVDYVGVERVRKAVREDFKAKEGFSLTYLPFISRAVIDALAEFPIVNSSVGDNELIVHNRIHLAIAVDLNFEGLIVPVVHDADQMRLRALARAMADLAHKARSRELTADDISGGTFTITNPGPFGTFLTFPVINQPQVAILSTDGIRKRPVAVELADGSDAVVVHPVGMLGLSFDHRAFDGAYASAFIAKVKQIIETRDWSQEV